MRLFASTMLLLLFHTNILFSMSDGPLTPPDKKEAQSNDPHLYLFPELTNEHVYHIQQYLHPTRRHATIRRGLGQARADVKRIRKIITLGLSGVCTDIQEPHKFIIYTALPTQSWFKNPWYCLTRLTEEQVMESRIATHEAKKERKKYMQRVEIQTEEKKSELGKEVLLKRLAIVMRYSSEEDIQLSETVPLTPEQKYKFLYGFLPENSLEQYGNDCDSIEKYSRQRMQEIKKEQEFAELSFIELKYKKITKDELALCDTAIKRLVDFLTDDEGKVQFGPIETKIYEFILTLYENSLHNEQLYLSYALKKQFPDYATNTSDQFARNKNHIEYILTHWPIRYAQEKLRLQRYWKSFKVYKLQ